MAELPSLSQCFLQCKVGSNHMAGGATEACHAGLWSNLRDYDIKATQDVAGITSGGGPQSSGRIMLEEIHCKAELDIMSPELFAYCCSGKAIDVAVIEYWATQTTANTTTCGSGNEKMIVYMTGVQVTSFNFSENRRNRIEYEYDSSKLRTRAIELPTGASGGTSPYSSTSVKFTLLYTTIRWRVSGATRGWDMAKNVPYNTDFGNPTLTNNVRTW